MDKFIDELYKLELPDNTIRSVLLLMYDAKPNDHDIIFKNIKTEEMATIKKPMKIIQSAAPVLKTKPSDCDGCPEIVIQGAPMEKMVITAPKTKSILQEEIVTVTNTPVVENNRALDLLNMFNSDKGALIEYARSKGYEVRMNWTALTIAQKIAEYEN